MDQASPKVSRGALCLHLSRHTTLASWTVCSFLFSRRCRYYHGSSIHPFVMCCGRVADSIRESIAPYARFVEVGHTRAPNQPVCQPVCMGKLSCALFILTRYHDFFCCLFAWLSPPNLDSMAKLEEKKTAEAAGAVKRTQQEILALRKRITK